MKFLILDDDQDYKKLVLKELQHAFHDASLLEILTQNELDTAIQRWDFDVVITDLDNPGLNGLDVCRQIRERDPCLPVIMLTASGNEEVAVEGMKMGLSDYVTKQHLRRLPVSIRECMEKARLHREYEKTNKLLMASEERFHIFMENSPTASFIKDINLYYVYVNETFRRFFNIELNNILGKTDFDLWRQDTAKKLREDDMLALSENNTTELCETVFTPDNILRYWLTFRFPLKDASEQQYLGGVAIDITERRLLEIRQATQFILTDIFSESATLETIAPKILQSICEGFGWELGELWVFDTDSNLLRLKNFWHAPALDASAFEDFSRSITFSPGTGLPGRVWASVQPAWITDVVADNNFLRSNIAAKLGLHGAMAFPLLKGKAVVGVMAFFSRDKRQPDNNLTNIMIDISKRIGSFISRKQAEELLRVSEHKYKTLLENLPQKIFHKDKYSVYVACNESYARDLKIRPYEIAGKTDYDFFPKELADKYRADDKRIMDSGKSGEIEEKYIRNGLELTIQTVKTPIKGEKGNITGILGIFWDITERKRTEQEKEKLREQLFHAQKIDSIGTLAGGIAHDFNNILSAIIGYGSLLLTKTEESSPERDFAQKIIKSAERAAQLTRGLLAFSRKHQNNPEPVNINEIVKSVNDLLSRLIREDIKLRTILTDKDCIVMADSNQIEQVLMNFSTNARDAMPNGGCLTISTDVIFMDDTFVKVHGYGETGMYALISVSDTGIGMDEKTKQKIFEPFFTTKEVGKGTGLGLAIVYGIVKQHNGYINVYSEPGRGTTFRVYLPLIKPAGEKMKAEIHIVPKGGTETILLAEDDADVRNIVKISLEGHGYTVIEAVDGIDAINKFNENKDRIQLLLLDVIMPAKNGKEVYKTIKNTIPNIKAIFMSGYSKDIIQEKDIIREALNFLTKPVLPMELLKKVREVLDM